MGDAGDTGEGDASVPDPGTTDVVDAGKEPDAIVPVGPRRCGNGQVEDGEGCDDGNDQNGDGCSATCELEDGFACPVPGADCEQCGNGIVESTEECDDGGRSNGDGCDADCNFESGDWVCPIAGLPCELCGDGIIALNEVCDDGNAVGGDGCAADCRSIEEHFACGEAGQACIECGDGVVAGQEQCDDGNTASEDGCTFNCKAVEPGYVCDPSGGACTLCGDGTIEGVEVCDDGNFVSGDGCSNQCQLEAGATCLTQGQLCSVCGNGVRDVLAVDGSGQPTAFEACDEGDLADGVGCVNNCQEINTADGWSCPVFGFECGRCGDGVVQQIEACDEGPSPIDAAGCAADCTMIDANFNCPPDGGECTRCGNGILETGEACDDGIDPTFDVPVGGDGCSRNCLTVEDGYVCKQEGDGTHIGCSKCGNGKKELDEMCDDSNTVGGDGCSADCSTVEDGYNCFFAGFDCVQCGNGVIEPGEECDEGHLATPANATDGCDDQCRVVMPWVCLGANLSCVLCGDGEIDPAAEECDDGNVANDDGCSATCSIEDGYDCSGASCTAAACGDGFRAGLEECDDGNQQSGDGCSILCHIEKGYVCPGADVPCRLTECGDGAVEGDEQCDDGNLDTGDGCNDSCLVEVGFKCPTPGAACEMTTCGDSVVEGAEQCDDGNVDASDGCDTDCQLEWGYACPDAGSPCGTIECGDGLVQGLEACDDMNAVAEDGCSDCLVDPLYRCTNEPDAASVCAPVIEFVAVRTFNIQNVDPAGLIYDPAKKSFGGYKASEGNKAPIELCLDGTVIDQNSTTAGADGTIFKPDGTIEALSPDYVPYIRPFGGSETVVGAAYDPFTGHFLFLTVSGQKVVLTEVPSDYTEAMYGPLTDFQEELTGLAIPAGMTVGDDGDLYVVDDDQGTESVVVFLRERALDGSIEPVGGTSFETTASASGWAVGTSDALDAIFTVPGENMVGVFNTPDSPSDDLYFRFYDPALTSDPPLVDLSALPGELFNLGSVGTSYTQYGRAAETAADGAAFVMCVKSASEPCQLFARVCSQDTDCSDAVAGTSCNTAVGDGELAYCHQPAVARDDRTTVAKNSTGTVIDVLANDTLSESACTDPVKRIVDTDTTDTQGTVTCTEFECTYDAPEGESCGFIDTFTYTADLGGGIQDDATVRVVIACVCGDGQVDGNEQCDDGDPEINPEDPAPHNGDAESKCLADCTIRIECGDGFIDPGEECDDGVDPDLLVPVSGDGCSNLCTLESVCGDGLQEGVEECDDGNITSGDGCNANCTLPRCGDGNLDLPLGEQCDDGNLIVGDGCDNACNIETECGNGLVELGEQCDDGNNVNYDGCSASCTIETECGDMIVDTAAGEECDPNAPGVQCGGKAGCTTICLCANYCGDLRIGGVEECDGGDDCRAPGSTMGMECTLKVCGDGFLDTDMGEECDDGNTNPADTCSNACTLITECGDGTKEGAEECDDGNNVSGDGCSSACKSEVAECGDGILHFTEQCDDGNNVNDDGCSATCRLEGSVCGDGIMGVGEDCDDGNADTGDGCRPDCTLEVCGDNIVDRPTEGCDDGNTTPGDGCSANCLFEVE